ncbi:amino acid ABC transporter permease [Mesorhizobium australicum]|uniref:Amino acid ABC transporter membrane protein 2, PAAT family n=1 Tax=Mesorhizobium australicum TaxID=536018 RepID=A0A1X7MTT9_9HYPH|nr:amino acid ABC transporter permease [Mesorhizobium australicum]SMH27748.1 amino acid ABC transporter membrane protein 2, PAAT family [Mesorhizobium australicum]
MDTFLGQFFNLAMMQRAWPLLWQGLQMTLLVSAVVVPGGVICGAILASVQSMSNRAVNALLIVYIDFFRAFPPLVLLIFIYYGMPFFGVDLAPFSAVCLAMVLNISAYFSEVVRTGIESVSKGQIEAARATGLTRMQTLWYVTLPQAIRNVMPDLLSNILETIKNTSLASVVTLPELLRMARVAQGNMYNTSPLVAAALLYLLLLWPLVRFITYLQNKKLTQ